MRLVSSAVYNPSTGFRLLPFSDRRIAQGDASDIAALSKSIAEFLPDKYEKNANATNVNSLAAARALLTNAGIPPESLDAIIVATATPEMGFPSEACLIQLALGARNVDYAIDINAFPDNIFAGIHIGTTSPSYRGEGYKLVIIADSNEKWDKLSESAKPPRYLGGAIALLFHNDLHLQYPVGIPSLPYLATGHYLPGKPISNEELVSLVRELNQYDANETLVKTFPSSVSWIETMVGAKNRYYSSPDEDCVDLAEQALLLADKRSRGAFAPEKVTAIGCSTISGQQDVFNPAKDENRRPKYSVYPVARRLAERIGAKPLYAVDVSAACAGSTIANYVVNTAPVPANAIGQSIVNSVEQLDRIIDFDIDRDSNLVLFGSGDGIVIQGPRDPRYPLAGLRSLATTSNPFDGRAMDIYRNKRGLIKMPNGGRVLKDATRSMIANSHAAMEYAGWTKDMIDLMAPHQANQRIIDAVMKKDGLDPAIVLQTIQMTANISNATVPVGISLLDEEGRISYLVRGEKGTKIVETQFGSGVVGSAAACQY